MANRYITNEPHTRQTRLPPIRRKYGDNNSSVLQDLGYNNFQSSLPRLPRIESRASKTCLPHQEREGNQRSSNSFITIEEKFSPLRLAATELRNPFERSTEFDRLKGNEKSSLGSGLRGVDGIYFDGDLPKNGTFKVKPTESTRPLRRPAHLLRRRLRPSKAYQHSEDQIPHRELLTLDQNMDQLRAFTEREKDMDVYRDFNGAKMDPNKTGNGNITSYMAMLGVERRTDNSIRDDGKSTSTVETGHDDGLPQESEQTKLRVHGRFYEALDLHFYHYYRNAHPERRMAICEELEHSIVIENTTLSWYRETLRLQDVLNTWML